MKIKAFWLQPSPVLRDHSGDRQHTCWNIKYQNSKGTKKWIAGTKKGFGNEEGNNLIPGCDSRN